MELFQTIQNLAIPFLDAAKNFLINNWSIVIGVVAAYFAIKLLEVGIKVAVYILVVALVLRILPELSNIFPQLTQLF